VKGLRAAGIAPSLAVAVAEEAPEDEEERAVALANTRAPRLRGLPPEKAFGRLSSLLMRRGYGPGVARDAARKALALEESDE
jgi:regulatory protein